MAKFQVALLIFSVVLLQPDATKCNQGWTLFKDKLWIKSFDNLVHFDKARQFCLSQGAKTSLVMVKDLEMQQFITNYTRNISETFWLGGKYDNDTAQFRWTDGDSVTYTNWADDGPETYTGPYDTCIQLAPGISEGKWTTARCKERNRPLCQKPSSWTFEDATGEIWNLQKLALQLQIQLDSATGAISTLQQRDVYLQAQLDNATRHIQALDARNLEFQTQLDNSNSVISNLEKQNSQLHIQLSNALILKLQKQHRQLQSQMNDEVKALKAADVRLEWVLESANNDNSQFRRSLNTVSNKVSSLERSVSHSKSTFNSRLNYLSTTIAFKSVPVGFIYMQYYNQQSPTSIWPTFAWRDVSSTYAGMFFRVNGGTSEEWGHIQSECSPQITKMEYEEAESGHAVYSPLNMPSSGWSRYGRAGYNHYDDEFNASTYHEKLRFYVQECEVRPRNQAVRIWKRTG